MLDSDLADDFHMHYESTDRKFERGQVFHNFNEHDYMVLEAFSPNNLVVMDMKSGSLVIALGATEYNCYPSGQEPISENTKVGVSWDHGIYLGSNLSETNFRAYKQRYGTEESIDNLMDYRISLKKQFRYLLELSEDKDVPANIKSSLLDEIYDKFHTIDEDTFYERLEDGKYDAGFKKDEFKRNECR